MRLDISPYEALKDSEDPVVISVDATGIRIHKSEGWVEYIRGEGKHYIKIHFAVDVKTKEVLSMEVTGMMCMIQKPSSLVEEASKYREVTEAYMDSAYNSSKTIGGIVKPKSNSCGVIMLGVKS